jgi:hypothetical protein
VAADEAAVLGQRAAEIERQVGQARRQDTASLSAMPPQCSSISSRTVTPAGASFTPGSLTRPETE